MDLLTLTILCLPWMVVGLHLVFMVRLPSRLPAFPGPRPEGLPRVSIVVPARNEENNLPTLLASLTALDYPSYEILVVDDESEDRTRDLVLSTSPGRAESLCLIQGKPLPPAWLGKPWACHQGALEASGEILLFTDADTRHQEGLLTRTVYGLLAQEADALSLLGQQVMGSFWERLVQPQFFTLLAFRFPRTGTRRAPGQWKDAIANGQYLLFRREAYDDIGGHEAVREEVVEDMRLAQILVREGKHLLIHRDAGLQTRMYQSLGGLVDGWSKNIATGALQAFPGLLQPIILPLSFLLGVLLWVVPPVTLAWGLLQGGGNPALAWSSAAGGGSLAFPFGLLTTGFGVAFWGFMTWLMGGSPLYGSLYPLASLLTAYIFVLSWIRGSRIRWKGRSYRVSDAVRRGLDQGESDGDSSIRERGP